MSHYGTRKPMDPVLFGAVVLLLEAGRRAALDRQAAEKKAAEYVPPLARANAQRATPL